MSSAFGHSFGPMAVMPSLPNDEAIIRLVGALMPETSDEWTVARRCTSPETLAPVTDNPAVRLFAVATRSSSNLSEGRRSYTTTWETIGVRVRRAKALQGRPPR
jgi:hypothetical protein